MLFFTDSEPNIFHMLQTVTKWQWGGMQCSGVGWGAVEWGVVGWGAVGFGAVK